MSFLSDIGHSISKAGKKAGKQLSTNIRHLPQAAKQIGEVGAFPVTAAIGSVGSVLTAAAPVLGQATQILQDNPMLGQALGTMVPGMGGLFSGGAPSAGGPIMMPAAEPEGQAQPGMPMWVWLAAGAAALVGLFLFLRRKA
jgi:hypothetical protein